MPEQMVIAAQDLRTATWWPYGLRHDQWVKRGLAHWAGWNMVIQAGYWFLAIPGIYDPPDEFGFSRSWGGAFVYSLAVLIVTLCCTLFGFWFSVPQHHDEGKRRDPVSRLLDARAVSMWLFFFGFAALMVVGVWKKPDPTVPEIIVGLSAMFTLYMPGIIVRMELWEAFTGKKNWEALTGKSAAALPNSEPAKTHELTGLL
jgi:hypothetical protein